MEIFYLFIYGLLPEMSACHGAIRVSYSLTVRPCTPNNNNNNNDNIMFTTCSIYRKKLAMATESKLVVSWSLRLWTAVGVTNGKTKAVNGHERALW